MNNIYIHDVTIYYSFIPSSLSVRPQPHPRRGYEHDTGKT